MTRANRVNYEGVLRLVQYDVSGGALETVKQVGPLLRCEIATKSDMVGEPHPVNVYDKLTFDVIAFAMAAEAEEQPLLCFLEGFSYSFRSKQTGSLVSVAIAEKVDFYISPSARTKALEAVRNIRSGNSNELRNMMAWLIKSNLVKDA